MKKTLCLLLSLVMALSVLFSLSLVPAEAASKYASKTATYDGYYKDEGVRRWYYAHLSKKEKACYRAIVKEIGDMPAAIEVPYELDDDMAFEIWMAVSYDNPEYFFQGHGSSYGEIAGKYYYIPRYVMSKERYETGKAMVDKKLKQIVDEANTKSSDYEKILYVHDYIAAHANYTYDGLYKYDVYGCLVDGQCNCEGYSRTNQLILNALGIPNHPMCGMGFSVDEETGEETAGGHMWNIVTCDGKEYNVDVTWDDGIDGYTQFGVYFPSGIKAETNHAYFMRSSKAMSGDHRAFKKSDGMFNGINSTFIWKGARDDTRTYYDYKDIRYSTYDDKVLNDLATKMAKAIMNGDNSYEIAFQTDKAYAKAVKKLFGDETGEERDPSRQELKLIKLINKKVDKAHKIKNDHIVTSRMESQKVLVFYPGQTIDTDEVKSVLAVIFQMIPTII